MATELAQGMRRYTCLVPVVLKDTASGQTLRYEHVHLVPVTRRTERRWQDGEIQGPYGALEALIAELLVEPYYVVEEMQYPDVELFNREFLAHLPRSIADMLASGRYPAPAPPPPTGYDPGDDPEPAAPVTQWPVDRPAAPQAPSRPSDPPYVGPDKEPDPAPAEGLKGLNLELAEVGPDESLGSLRQRQEADQAFEARANPGDGTELARELVAEDESQSPALRAAVKRAARETSAMVQKAEPKREIDGGWVPTARDPFNPEPPEPPKSVNRPPTRVSAEQIGKPADAKPVIDPRTKREAVFVPPPDYVPDMSAAGYEEPAVRQSGVNNAFGIGDIG